MAVAFDAQFALVQFSPLERAILETLAYSDVFDHPLTLDELHRFLVFSASKEDVLGCVTSVQGVDTSDGYYFLSGRKEILEIRKQREEHSRRAFQRAIFYGQILVRLPFIRMAVLTGSLAMLNLSKNRDMDYLLVARPGRVWMARAFALLFGRLAKLFGDVICPNVVVSENSLEWKDRNLYTAREFIQMHSIGGEDVLNKIRVVNRWVEDILPNAVMKPVLPTFPNSIWRVLQAAFEIPIGGRLGDFLEAWEMQRKTSRFKGQAGYGVETNFSTEICQGNFDHHNSSTMQAYEKRLALFVSQQEQEK